MKRTTTMLDPALLQEAARPTGEASPSATVRRALAAGEDDISAGRTHDLADVLLDAGQLLAD